jgi:manganese/zinc/iron transport system permease protein
VPAALRHTKARLTRRGQIQAGQGSSVRLTDAGRQAAREVVRRHRLWETYLITHADVAAGMVDLSADRIEHVLEPDLIRQLEAKLSADLETDLPASPHALAAGKGRP